jgi:hypothetical protein
MVIAPVLRGNMREQLEAEVINGWLERNAPKIPLTDKPMFKLVWSDDQYELRTGNFREFLGDIFVREVKKTERTLKYNYLSEMWILEQWFPPDVSFNEELPESIHGSFEPLYVFADKNNTPLPLKLDVVQFIIRTLLTKSSNKLFLGSYAKTLREEKERIARKQDWDILSDEGPLVSQFHDGSAIILPGKSIQ